MNFKEFILSENKQEIVALGFPKVIADIIYDNFGKNAFQVAKWNKDYSYKNDQTNWWHATNTSSNLRSTSLGDYVLLYNASFDPEQYKKTYEDVYGEKSSLSEIDDMEEHRSLMKKRIEADLLDQTFFSHFNLIKDIRQEKLTDLSPYKKLSFLEASDKYEKKNVFKDTTPIKVYENGWKWINVGKKCNLLGKMMSNCGSAGLMSMDSDSTIIALFDKGNKAHVMVTYSPNEKRISGDEGAGTTPVKDKYSDYVLDLADRLGVVFDAHKSKSNLIRVKYFFADKLKSINRFDFSNTYNEYFKVITKDGKEYFSTSDTAISKEDADKLSNFDFTINLGNIVKNVLDYRNINKIIHSNLGINYINLITTKSLKSG
jgi:hypothetical protein